MSQAYANATLLEPWCMRPIGTLVYEALSNLCLSAPGCLSVRLLTPLCALFTAQAKTKGWLTQPNYDQVSHTLHVRARQGRCAYATVCCSLGRLKLTDSIRSERMCALQGACITCSLCRRSRGEAEGEGEEEKRIRRKEKAR